MDEEMGKNARRGRSNLYTRMRHLARADPAPRRLRGREGSTASTRRRTAPNHVKRDPWRRERGDRSARAGPEFRPGGMTDATVGRPVDGELHAGPAAIYSGDARRGRRSAHLSAMLFRTALLGSCAERDASA